MKTWQYQWQLYRFTWRILVPTIIANLLLYGLIIIPGLVVRELFNGLTGDAPLRLGLWSIIALLTATAVVRQTLYCLFAAGRTTVGHLIAALLQHNLLARVFQMPGARALPYSTGEALSRFRDDVHQVSGFLGTAYHFLGTVFMTAIAAVLLLRINAWVTIIVFIPLGIVTFILQQSRSRLVRYREASQATTGNVAGTLGEIFRVVQVIKLADATESVVTHTETLNNSRRRAALQDRMFTEVLNAVALNINDVGTGLILLLIGQSMQLGASGALALTVGDFALFVFALPWVGSLIGASIGVQTRYRQVGVSFERLATLMQGADAAALVRHHPVYLRGALPPRAEFSSTIANQPIVDMTTPKTQSSRALCDVRGLTYVHPETAEGIRDVNFRLPRGSFTIITGRVGAGKTTLLRVLLGLLPKDSGEILWAGELVDDPATFFIPPRSAYTPQVPRLFSVPLRENILMGLEDVGSGGVGSGGVGSGGMGSGEWGVEAWGVVEWGVVEWGVVEWGWLRRFMRLCWSRMWPRWTTV